VKARIVTLRTDRTPSAVASTSDAQLVAEMQAQNSEALGALLRRYARLVHRVAVGILRDSGEAEDITQEVFLEIYRKAHMYDPARGTVKVWLLQYAYHRALRRKYTLGRRAAYCGEPLDQVEAVAEWSSDRLTRDECRWFIRKGLAQLTERQRETLELVCLEELTLRDVADRLRVSLGCARHYYYRGLERLRAWARPRSTKTLAAGHRAVGRRHRRIRPLRRQAEGGQQSA
jgi:RNA polymerase sigma-70 factor, ECF subfamily